MTSGYTINTHSNERLEALRLRQRHSGLTVTVWVLGIVNVPPTKVWVVYWDETAFCDAPTFVVEM